MVFERKRRNFVWSLSSLLSLICDQAQGPTGSGSPTSFCSRTLSMKRLFENHRYFHHCEVFFVGTKSRDRTQHSLISSSLSRSYLSLAKTCNNNRLRTIYLLMADSELIPNHIKLTQIKGRLFLVACYATLHPAMSVGWFPFG